MNTYTKIVKKITEFKVQIEKIIVNWNLSDIDHVKYLSNMVK